jgi:NAD(P)-dependent dehydrogenase (short-subunit alcohol dehydrogenase family)|tara:strand:- start:3230 stop:4000 length:771 start_codon:yes stop_codon:yes gene_type:complete
MSNPTRYALVTGANGGIGKAICEEFSANGYRVLATDCQPQPITDLACSHYLPLDLQTFVQDETVAERFLKEVKTLVKDGELQALINNAAIQILGGVDSLTRKDWQTTLDVNLSAPFLLSQGLVNELEAAKGSIVNISSIHAKLTKKNFVAYATSKAALSGMTRAMAVDLGPRVRVNAIEPAAIETEMLKAGFKDSLDFYKKLKNHHPTQTLGKTKEIGCLALFLTAKNAKFIHGSCIDISGGITSSLNDPKEFTLE